MTDILRLATKIRLRQLRCFVTVARKKSFVLAAEHLGLTQPAVSRSIKELEHILGQDLFDRTVRGATLTPNGQAFLDSAEAAILQINSGLQVFSGDTDAHEYVRIGALPNVCSQFLPPIVKDFKEDHPLAGVHVIPGTNAGLLDCLRRGEADFVIGRLSSSEDMRGLTFEALFDEPLIFVVKKDHPLAGAQATLEEALGYPLLLPPEGTIIRDEVDRFFAGRGVAQPRDTIESTSSDFLRTYLVMSEAVAAIPRGVVYADLAQGDFVQLPFGETDLKGPVGLTTNPSVSQGAIIQDMIGRIKRYQD